MCIDTDFGFDPYFYPHDFVPLPRDMRTDM